MLRAAALLTALLFASTASAAGTVIDVTTTADDGPGSYRDAIRQINERWNMGCYSLNPCTIRFAIPGPVPPSGWFTIAPKSPLPTFSKTWTFAIDATYQTTLTGDTNPYGPEIELDGTDAGFSSGIRMHNVGQVSIRGLAVNNFGGHGISLVDAHGVNIGFERTWAGAHDAVYVGVDPTGMSARPNGLAGIATIGSGSIAVDNSIVSGNRDNGIWFGGGRGSREHIVRNSRIGVGRKNHPIPNGANGIHVSAETAWIYWNTVAHNPLFGVVTDDPGGRVRISGNRIYDNGLLNIGVGFDGEEQNDGQDLDLGPNGRMNTPLLTSATATGAKLASYPQSLNVSGSIDAKPSAEYTIDVFAAPRHNASGRPNAQVVVGSTRVTTDVSGKAAFTLEASYTSSLVPDGWVTATATTWEGTSELSAPIRVHALGIVEVNTVADEGPGSFRDAIERANEESCSLQIPCWIVFRVPADSLKDGVALFEPRSPLPPVTSDFVHVDGSSQSWLVGETNADGPEVEIRGDAAGPAAGLRLGTAERPLAAGWVNGIAVTGFQGDGVEVRAANSGVRQTYPDLELRNVFVGLDASGRVRANHGDGITLRGMFSSDPVVRDSFVGGNDRNGVRIFGSGAILEQTRIGVAPAGSAAPNGDAGLLVDGGSWVKVNDCTIAHNYGAGVSTTRDARNVYVRSAMVWNGGLAIDRNADGPGGGAAEGVTPPPVIRSAAWDPEKKATVIEGEFGAGKPDLSFPRQISGEEMQVSLFVNQFLESDGSAEAERPLPRWFPPTRPIVITGGTFRVEILDDLRGWFLTAAAHSAYCLWEFGCHGQDTSELSAPVQVK